MSIYHPTHLDHQSLIDIISAMDIDFVSALQISTRNVKIEMESTEKINIVHEKDWGTGFHVLHQGKDAFYSHNDHTQSPSRIIDLVRRLKRWNLEDEVVDPFIDNDSHSEPNPVSIDLIADAPFIDGGEEALLSFLTILGKHIEGEGLQFDLSAKLVNEKRTLQNSELSQISQKMGYATIDLNIFSSSQSLVLSLGGISKTDLDFEEVILKINNNIEILRSLENSRKVKSGESDCLLSNDAAFSLLHEAIGHAAEGDQIINSESYLSNRVGYKVASSLVTLTDDPHLRGIGFAEYDDEGTKTQGTLIVEDGILMDFLHTRKTAQLLNSAPTGNARVSTYLYPPEPRQSNLFVEPKDYKEEELIEEVKNGIYLGPTRLASTSIYSGELQIQTSYAQKIENGELTEYIQPTFLNGNSLEILRNVKAVGTEIEKFPTECLKSKSKVLIGAYSPKMVISEVRIS